MPTSTTFAGRGVTFVCGVIVSMLTVSAAASDHDALIQRLVAQVESLEARLASLEAEKSIRVEDLGRNDQFVSLVASEVASQRTDWTNRIKLKGDVRYRHETLNTDTNRERHRQRVRARVGIGAQVSDTVEVGVGLATGGDDPRSTNQSLDDGFSTKDIRLDQAYAKWQANGFTVTGGKFKNVLHRAGGTELAFDGDLTTEGVGVQYGAGPFFATGVALWLDESGGDDDSFLAGGQFGIKQDYSNGRDLRAGIGYYNVIDGRGESPFFDGNQRGNSVDGNGDYLFGFEVVEAFAEFGFEAGGVPIVVFADYLQNLDADDFDTGYAIGANATYDRWNFGYYYQELEANATLGLITSSDFGGGGTDNKGHVINGGYALTDKINLRGTLFLNERNGDLGIEEDFDRLQLDINFKY